MRIISFSYLWPAVAALAKDRTRRWWDPLYAESFYAGEVLQAYDRSPRIGGRRFGVVQLTRKPWAEPLARMPDSDYAREGFKWLYEHPEFVPETFLGKPCTHEDFSPRGFDRWRKSGGEVYVVEFKVVSVEPFVSKSFVNPNRVKIERANVGRARAGR